MTAKEQLLHYVWMYRLIPSDSLTTIDGQYIEVIDPGMHNRDAGPDFFNAKIKIGDKIWAGNVEIHCSSDDWVKHGHSCDKAYNSVILHLAENANAPVFNQLGEKIPQCVITVPNDIRANADYLIFSLSRIPCKQFLNIIPSPIIYSWLNRLSIERLERKTDEIFSLLERYNDSWDEVFYLVLTRNFGFGLNSEEFQGLAFSLPFNYILRHSDNLFQIEALLFGQAGMLKQKTQHDVYYVRLKEEYAFLSAKYSLQSRDDLYFKSMRIRPRSFPQIRIAQLASLLQSSGRLFSHILVKEDIREIRTLFQTSPSAYWETHYNFGVASPKMDKPLGESSLDILLINTVVPILFAYGRRRDSEKYCDKAIRFMEALKPERNSIVREFAQAGVTARHAFDSQALIQLCKEYCDTRKCLYCTIGHKLLTSTHLNQ